MDRDAILILEYGVRQLARLCQRLLIFGAVDSLRVNLWPSMSLTKRGGIAHVLFTDIVGYSKLLTDQQRELLQQLSQIIRSAEPFRSAEAEGKLVRLPTGDGMALAFFTAPMRRCDGARNRAGRDTVSYVLEGSAQRRMGDCEVIPWT